MRAMRAKLNNLSDEELRAAPFLDSILDRDLNGATACVSLDVADDPVVDAAARIAADGV